MAFQKIEEFAVEISRKAGDILLKGFRSKDTEISYKSRTDLVTNIDRESEEFLYNSIKKKFPDHSIVAEEGSREDREGEFLWYVDPLDATNNFAHGIPFFCVSIGIYSRQLNKVVTGVVFDPLHNELFKASRGEGAFLNGGKIHVSQAGDIGISILATGFPYNKADVKNNNLAEFNKFLPLVQGVRRLGSAALDLCYLACGRIDGYWEPGLKPWDMAGGSIIVEEAGGLVTKYNKDEFDPAFPQIIASNARIHEKMISVLNSQG
ncbi:MAG: inositol monophosphatase [Spirochaetes bacterium]|nr:inositol monophosphatase [Spirochaetota bacterium]